MIILTELYLLYNQLNINCFGKCLWIVQNLAEQIQYKASYINSHILKYVSCYTLKYINSMLDKSQHAHLQYIFFLLLLFSLQKQRLYRLSAAVFFKNT